jgi:choline dehydrogenase-like flavoprotein
METDVIIIGSGPAGVHAALALVERGVHTIMIDGGIHGSDLLYEDVGTFTEMRKNRSDQWKWFLGQDLSAIPVEGLRGGLGGGMTSGNRRFVTEQTDIFGTVQNNIQVIETLAEGGLATAWGAACTTFSSSTLASMRLPVHDMSAAYQNVIDRIGVSGVSGVSDEYRVQPPLPLDHHALACMAKFKRREQTLQKRGFRLGQPLSAVLTEPLNGRMATALRDTEYYCDPEHAVYRPRETLKELLQHPCFRYAPGWLVEAIRPMRDTHEIVGKRLGTNERVTIATGKKIILCAGAVGSARLLLASLNIQGAIPFIAKSHAYIACLRPSGCLQAGPATRSSLCQLILEDEQADGGPSTAQLYSYRSLLLFRLLGNIPLPVPLAFNIAKLLAPGLVLADVRFHSNGPNAQLQLQNGNVHVTGTPGPEELTHRAMALRRLRSALGKIGLWPAKTVLLPEGSSSHYAGSVPIDGTGLLSATVDGQVTGLQNVYVADASLFPSLPSGPHTLTIMANALRIAERIVADWRH